MNRHIVGLTFRQLISRRRSLLMLLLALLPLGITVLMTLTADDLTELDRLDYTTDILSGFSILVILPIFALIFSTAALGSEIEDGTAVYLLSKPISRAAIVFSKFLVAFVVTAVLVTVSIVPAGMLALEGTDPERITLGFTLGGIVGAFVYTGLFTMLSVLTSRALIAGLVYVFLWEGIITNLFQGLRIFSVREYTLGVADGIVDIPEVIWEANLGLQPAVVAALILVSVATAVAINRLRSFELGETA